MKRSVQLTLAAAVVVAVSLVTCSQARAQSLTGDAKAESGSTAGANAYVGGNYFAGAPGRQRVDTTAPVYTAPATFASSGGAVHCGAGSTASLGKTGLGIGLGIAGESDPCNARADTDAIAKFGPKLIDVAEIRFFCFGEDVNRMAYEASGRACPWGSTAKGLPEYRHVSIRDQPVVPFSYNN